MVLALKDDYYQQDEAGLAVISFSSTVGSPLHEAGNIPVDSFPPHISLPSSKLRIPRKDSNWSSLVKCPLPNQLKPGSEMELLLGPYIRDEERNSCLLKWANCHQKEGQELDIKTTKRPLYKLVIYPRHEPFWKMVILI